MPIKVGMVSLGCSKNLVDSERMLYKLKSHGYKLVTEPGLADIAVVNTCGFIKSAKEEAIETILELAKLKAEGTLKKIVITGCLTERYKEEAAELFPEADAVIGIGNNKDIIDVLDHVLAGERYINFAPKLEAELDGERIIIEVSDSHSVGVQAPQRNVFLFQWIVGGLFAFISAHVYYLHCYAVKVLSSSHLSSQMTNNNRSTPK